jgi:hypothetical protein
MEPRYWAFVSYSSKDERVAKALHRRIETYAVPRDLVGRPGRDVPVPRRLFPCFRDRDELPLSADLGASIQDALRASRYLIVLCSPHAAGSRWVNEEVRYFKSLGREDRILGVLLDGQPNASEGTGAVDAECFCPALRRRVSTDGQLTDERVEPVAGDLRPGGDGWRGVVLKAVAGITGLGLDAFVRREAKRRRRRQLGLVALLLPLLALGLWRWDDTRLKVSSFANLASRWGVPEGVGPIDDELRAGREAHYRVESRGGRVRRVLRQNGSGRLADDPGESGASIHEVHYRGDDSLQRIDLRDHNGRLVLRKEVGSLRPTPDGPTLYVDFREEHQDAPTARQALAGALARPSESGGWRSDITSEGIRFDDRGRPIVVTYYNAYRVTRANAEGVFGQRRTYLDGPLPVFVENLGPAGAPLSDRVGVTDVFRHYGALGDVEEERFHDGRGDPAGNAQWVARIVTQRDRFGNAVAAAQFGPDGAPVISRDGFHRRTAVYDARGNRVDARSFGVEGEPVADRNGYHARLQRFDERGNVIEWRFLGSDGAPAYDRDGVHRGTFAFDGRDNAIEEAIFGIDDAPTLHREGLHRIRRTLDGQGRITEEAYFGTAGEPVTIVRGFHRATMRYDERGQRVEQRVFGTDGAPTLAVGGYHLMSDAYDERGNLVREAYFGIDDRPVRASDGCHTLLNAFDERGNRTEQRLLGPDGLATAGRLGVSRISTRYDEQGNLHEEAYFGVDGAPALNLGRVHRVAWKFDARGNQVEGTHWGRDGRAVRHRDGYHRNVRSVDERGNILETQYFREDGSPGVDPDGVHRLVLTFDARGNRTRMLAFVWAASSRATRSSRGSIASGTRGPAHRGGVLRNRRPTDAAPRRLPPGHAPLRPARAEGRAAQVRCLRRAGRRSRRSPPDHGL